MNRTATLDRQTSESKVHVELDNGIRLLASVASDGLAGLGVGGPVRLAWSRSAATT